MSENDKISRAKKPQNATEAARAASADVDHAFFEGEMSGRIPRGYDVRLMRERERREAIEAEINQLDLPTDKDS